MDIPAEQVRQTLIELGITHVVWLPDSAIGPWEQALDRPGTLELVRVCREGEAWAIAAGLHLAGMRPLVMIQNTGLFESGDAMRNVLFDLRLPLAAIVGYRSFLDSRLDRLGAAVHRADSRCLGIGLCHRARAERAAADGRPSAGLPRGGAARRGARGRRTDVRAGDLTKSLAERTNVMTQFDRLADAAGRGAGSFESDCAPTRSW